MLAQMSNVMKTKWDIFLSFFPLLHPANPWALKLPLLPTKLEEAAEHSQWAFLGKAGPMQAGWEVSLEGDTGGR